MIVLSLIMIIDDDNNNSNAADDESDDDNYDIKANLYLCIKIFHDFFSLLTRGLFFHFFCCTENQQAEIESAHAGGHRRQTKE